MITRRTAIAGLGALAVAPAARAQAFPTRTITIVVPYPPGGPVDVLARLIAQQAAADLGHAITVDNRGGGSGVIGSVVVMRAEPDGHTLLLTTQQTHAANQSLIKNHPFDAAKDFAPVAGITEVPHILAVRRDLPASSVAELLKLGAPNSGGLNCGSSGNGSASHLTAELFKTRTGINLTHVPFRGAAPLVTELIAGRIDMSFATLPSVATHVDTGAVRALAIASGRRAERLPDVPTLKDAGVSGVEADAWFAMFAPVKTPADAIDRVYRAVVRALGSDTAKEVLAAQGMIPRLRSPAELGAMLPAEIEKWAGVIKAANIAVE
jgi:tripartite-type tricarboxylate transporter receptor subunit TctC